MTHQKTEFWVYKIPLSLPRFNKKMKANPSTIEGDINRQFIKLFLKRTNKVTQNHLWL
jgi:hypothetical protein